MLNTVALAQADSSITNYEQFAESLRRAVDKEFPLQNILVFATAFALFIITIVVYEIYRSSKIKQELLALAWKKFDYNVMLLRLSESSVAILKEIAWESDLQDPDSMIKSPHVFEKSLETYYKNGKIESMSSEKLKEIRDLRRKLHFLPLSREVAFTSTRQFDSGERCIVQIPDKEPATHKGMCTVLSSNEQQWFMARPEGPQVPAGTWVRINMTRPGDAEYAFRAQVLRDLNGELALSHVSQLNRTQQRNWVRVDVSVPVEITQIENGNVGDIFMGKIIDMSGGGFGMTLPIKLSTGSNLLLSFDIPEHGHVDNLLVKVVRVAGAVHSVAFEGAVHSIQEQIIQYIFEKQRHDSLIKHS
jgi:hypothetical protein